MGCGDRLKKNKGDWKGYAPLTHAKGQKKTKRVQGESWKQKCREKRERHNNLPVEWNPRTLDRKGMEKKKKETEDKADLTSHYTLIKPVIKAAGGKGLWKGHLWGKYRSPV